jgi:kynureninase
VTRFARAQGLDLARLRACSTAQTERIIRAAQAIGAVTVATPREAAARGGFVALETPRASALVDALRREGIYADARGSKLRLGPAPYVTDDEIDTAMGVLAKLASAR